MIASTTARQNQLTIAICVLASPSTYSPNGQTKFGAWRPHKSVARICLWVGDARDEDAS
jgi:hypothetical protein